MTFVVCTVVKQGGDSQVKTKKVFRPLKKFKHVNKLPPSLQKYFSQTLHMHIWLIFLVLEVLEINPILFRELNRSAGLDASVFTISIYSALHCAGQSDKHVLNSDLQDARLAYCAVYSCAKCPT